VEYAQKGVNIYTSQGPDINISSCIIRNNGTGIWLQGLMSFIISRNSFRYNTAGIYCYLNSLSSTVIGGSPRRRMILKIICLREF